MKAKLKYAPKYYRFLDTLQEMGVSDMLGTASHLSVVFPEINEKMAKLVIEEWQENFATRHPHSEEKEGEEDEKQRNNRKQSQKG